MPQKCKTPAGTGASRDSFAGLSLPLSTPLAIQAQSLIAAPVQNFTDDHMKLAGIFAEAGCGLVEVEDLAFIARDLDDLLGLASG